MLGRWIDMPSWRHHSPGPLGYTHRRPIPSCFLDNTLRPLFPSTVEKESPAQRRSGLYGGLGYRHRAWGHCPGSSQDELPILLNAYKGNNPTQKRSHIVSDLHPEEQQ
jgi:hypothetical protein